MKRLFAAVLALILAACCFLPAGAASGGAEGREIFSYKVGKLDGLGFTPYLKNQSAEDSRLKIGEEQIRERLGIIAPYTSRIRTFGCANGLEMIPRIASEEFGLGVAVGLWISEDAESNDAQILNAVKAADWAEMFIFSETVNLGTASVDTLIGCIRRLRRALKQAGHGDIPIVTSEPLVIYQNEGEALLDEVDRLSFNYHPAYDGVTPAEAGRVWFPEMLERAAKLAERYNLPVMVGETGFPTYAGDGDGEAARLGAAVYHMWVEYESRKRGVLTYSFCAFDESWKAKYGPLESKFGVWDEGGALKLPEIFAGGDEAFDPDAAEEADSGPDAPILEIDQWPADGNGFRVRGTLTGVRDPEDYRVTVWIRVGGVWWVKPTWDSAVQFVAPDGTFDIAATTPGAANDVLQDACSVLLFPADYEPDIYSYEANLPHALSVALSE